MDANIMKNMISQQHNRSNLNKHRHKVNKPRKSSSNSKVASSNDSSADHSSSKSTSQSITSSANISSGTSSVNDSEVNSNNKYITVKKRIPNSTLMPWTLTLSVDSIARLNALKKIYHFRNRDQAFKLLNNHSMKELISKKGRKGKKLFNLFKEAYKVSAEPKAVRRYKRAHK